MSTTEQVHEAIGVILSDTANYGKSLNYAVEYCRAAKWMSGHDLKVQCVYILGNITRWRHRQAKDVRETLKAYNG